MTNRLHRCVTLCSRSPNAPDSSQDVGVVDLFLRINFLFAGIWNTSTHMSVKNMASLPPLSCRQPSMVTGERVGGPATHMTCRHQLHCHPSIRMYQMQRSIFVQIWLLYWIHFYLVKLCRQQTFPTSNPFFNPLINNSMATLLSSQISSAYMGGSAIPGAAVPHPRLPVPITPAISSSSKNTVFQVTSKCML